MAKRNRNRVTRKEKRSAEITRLQAARRAAEASLTELPAMDDRLWAAASCEGCGRLVGRCVCENRWDW